MHEIEYTYLLIVIMTCHNVTVYLAQSCHEALAEWIQDQSAIMYGVMFGVAGVQVSTLS